MPGLAPAVRSEKLLNVQFSSQEETPSTARARRIGGWQ